MKRVKSELMKLAASRFKRNIKHIMVQAGDKFFEATGMQDRLIEARLYAVLILLKRNRKNLRSLRWSLRPVGRRLNASVQGMHASVQRELNECSILYAAQKGQPTAPASTESRITFEMKPRVKIAKLEASTNEAIESALNALHDTHAAKRTRDKAQRKGHKQGFKSSQVVINANCTLRDVQIGSLAQAIAVMTALSVDYSVCLLKA